MDEWEYLGDVDVCEWVHDRVEEIVNKNHPNDSTSRLLVLSFRIISTCTRPTGKNRGHADEGDEILSSTV